MSLKKRIDPADGVPYTLEELKRHCVDFFSEKAQDRFKEIAMMAYWAQMEEVLVDPDVEVPFQKNLSIASSLYCCEFASEMPMKSVLSSRSMVPIIRTISCKSIKSQVPDWIHHSASGYTSNTLQLPLGAVGRSCDELNGPIKASSVRNLLSSSKIVHNGILLFVQTPLDYSNPFAKAIQTNGEATISWLRNRGIEVERMDTAMHVGLIVRSKKTVVEAVPGYGVREQSCTDFFKQFEDVAGARFFLGTVLNASDEQADKAAQFALEQVGRHYASGFRPWTATDPPCFYCSSLVDYAYQKALDTSNAFFKEQYHFQFQPRQYWEEYYKGLGVDMPSGAGTNPTLLLHSPNVEYDELLFVRADPFSPMSASDLGWC